MLISCAALRLDSFQSWEIDWSLKIGTASSYNAPAPVLLLLDWSLKIVMCLWNWAPEYSNTSVCYPEYLILFLMGCKHLFSRNLKFGVTDSASLVGFSAWNQNSNSASEMKGDKTAHKTHKGMYCQPAYCGWILKNMLILSIVTNILGLILDHFNFSISI